jgi:hypothetical protein
MMAKDSVKKRLAGEGMSLLSLPINSRMIFIIYIRNTIACCKWGVQTNGEYYYWY